MVHKSTDMEVYNESKKRSKNLLVYNSKTTVAFIHFLTNLKENPNKLEYFKYESIRIDMEN